MISGGKLRHLHQSSLNVNLTDMLYICLTSQQNVDRFFHCTRPKYLVFLALFCNQKPPPAFFFCYSRARIDGLVDFLLFVLCAVPTFLPLEILSAGQAVPALERRLLAHVHVVPQVGILSFRRRRTAQQVGGPEQRHHVVLRRRRLRHEAEGGWSKIGLGRSFLCVIFLQDVVVAAVDSDNISNIISCFCGLISGPKMFCLRV